MIDFDILVNLSAEQIWRLQDISHQIDYVVGEEVFIFHAPSNKSIFKKSDRNPRVLGSRWYVAADRVDHVAVTALPDNRRRNIITLPKKYIISLSQWRQVQLNYLLQ